MHLIIGGRYMGKLQYALSLYGGDSTICDLANETPEKMFGARITINLQEGIRSMLKHNLDARRFFEERLSSLGDKILIGDEIGSGIVPSDPFERYWRDETGFIYQALARHAGIVDRLWAGLPTRLKGPVS